MKDYLSPFLHAIHSLLFPLPDRKKILPQSYSGFIKQFPPQSRSYLGITYFFRYKDFQIKEVVEEMKRYNNKKYFDFAGRIIAQNILAQTDQAYPVILIPLPQTAKRLRERGYDVTKSLVSAILKYLPPGDFEDGSDLLKHNRNYHQSGIKNRQERLNASHGMFKMVSCRPQSPFYGILIDDVCTTGASMKEAERILEDVGYSILRKITLARS